MTRKRGIYAGWFAEIPKELKEEFTKIYPGRKSIRLFTVAFVSWAIRHRPDIEALHRKWATEAQSNADKSAEGKKGESTEGSGDSEAQGS